MLRYRVTNSDGRRVENVMPIGLVRDFPKDKDAWREADRLGLPVRINDNPLPGRIRFDFLAEHYLRADFGADAVRPKSANTISHVKHIVRAYLAPRFGNEIAEDIKPLDIQRWFKSLHETGGLAWTTIAKMRGVMHRIYKIGILHERVAKNPAQHVETRSKTDYKAVVITPAQTLSILKALPSPHLFTSRWCSPAPLQRSALRTCWRCAGRTYCGRKDGFGFRSAGQTARMARPKQKAPMATCRYIPCSRASCVHGGHRRLSPPMGILFFHPSRRRAVFPSRRLFSSPIICDRRQRKPACTSRTGRGLDFTTCVRA